LGAAVCIYRAKAKRPAAAAAPRKVTALAAVGEAPDVGAGAGAADGVPSVILLARAVRVDVGGLLAAGETSVAVEGAMPAFARA